ncbi:MAG TPA: hypothetical protein DCR04_12210 [Flavobacteriales bacterium]|nr:lipocalin family protein [Flavobacteriales bacterium]HAP70464.1 hypothetical protein [Flavobacteriales bacterium]
MKNLIAVLLVVMVSTGCATKDEKARKNIAQSWRISKVFQNENDVTVTYLDTRLEYRLSLSNNGTFTESYRPFSGSNLINISGSWVFSDGINKVTLTDGNQTRIYQIDELSEDNFNITDLGSTNNLEILFVLD